MDHPSTDPDNADLVLEVETLATRALAAIKLLDPAYYRNTWEVGDQPIGELAVRVGDFSLRCSAGRTITVTDVSEGSRPFPILTVYLGGPLEFSWEPFLCREFLAPALQRVLLLEDLASL